MNWGWKIFIVYTLFVIMTLSMAFYFMKQDVHLVADDYYKKELEYQDQINKMTNAKALLKALEIKYDRQGSKVLLQFPPEQVHSTLKGKVVLYRPSDATKDLSLDVLTDSTGLQQIDASGLIKGFWKVKVEWSADGRTFYDEKTLTL